MYILTVLLAQFKLDHHRKMKAEKEGYFTQEEWTGGLVALGVDTLDKLKNALHELEKEVQSFYAFLLFSYSLSSSHHSTMSKKSLCMCR